MIPLAEIFFPNIWTMAHFHFVLGPANYGARPHSLLFSRGGPAVTLRLQRSGIHKAAGLSKGLIQRWTWYTHCTHPQPSKGKTNTEGWSRVSIMTSVELPAFKMTLQSLGGEDHSRPCLCPYLHSFGDIPQTKTEFSRRGPRTGHTETQTTWTLCGDSWSDASGLMCQSCQDLGNE